MIAGGGDGAKDAGVGQAPEEGGRGIDNEVSGGLQAQAMGEGAEAAGLVGEGVVTMPGAVDVGGEKQQGAEQEERDEFGRTRAHGFRTTRGGGTRRLNNYLT